MKYEVIVEGHDHTYEVEINEEGRIILDGQEVMVDFTSLDARGLYSLLVDGESFDAMVERREDQWQVLLRGHLYDVQITDERTRRLNARAKMVEDDTGETSITAPMPGRVVEVSIEEGQTIAKGENVVILESMKMENELKSPREGVILRVNVAEGDSVEQNQPMVVIGPKPEEE
jgi:biotin carboxyl carrier protein